MTEFLDKQFIKEFKDTMTRLRGENSLHMQEFLVPNNGHFMVNTSPMVRIRDIEDEYLKQFNNTEVFYIKKRTIDRNVYWNSGEIKRTEKYNLDTNSILISTRQDLGLPFGYDTKVKGLEYVDYRESRDGKGNFYYYSIPEKYCYTVNQTAIVAADKKKPKHYGGFRLASTLGYYIYLYIVDLKGLKNIDSQKIIKTGMKPEELKQSEDELIRFWIREGQIYNFDELETEVPVDSSGSTNLAYEEFEPTEDYDNYSEYSMAEMKLTARQIANQQM